MPSKSTLEKEEIHDGDVWVEQWDKAGQANATGQLVIC